jgi:hypothetical protein
VVRFTPRPLYTRENTFRLFNGWAPELAWTSWSGENIWLMFVLWDQRNLQNCSFESGFVVSKMWFHILRAENKSKEFDNRVLNRIFEHKWDAVERDL